MPVGKEHHLSEHLADRKVACPNQPTHLVLLSAEKHQPLLAQHIGKLHQQDTEGLLLSQYGL
jgi:hypothetical protein